MILQWFLMILMIQMISQMISCDFCMISCQRDTGFLKFSTPRRIEYQKILPIAMNEIRPKVQSEEFKPNSFAYRYV